MTSLQSSPLFRYLSLITMTDNKVKSPDPLDHSEGTTEVDGALSLPHPDISAGSPEPATALSSTDDKRPSFLGRAFSKQNKDVARHFLSSYFPIGHNSTFHLRFARRVRSNLGRAFTGMVSGKGV
jgi:hypothetical protein